jgi:hypothetical protein
MTATTPTESSRSRRSTRRRNPTSPRAGRAHVRRRRQVQGARHYRRPLGRYLDASGRMREVIARHGFAGTLLVVDRDASTGRDQRLVAHLGADEPRENAELICTEYLRQAPQTGCVCRSLTDDDLRAVPFADEHPAAEWWVAQRAQSHELVDPNDRAHRLELVQTGMSIPELRWRRLTAGACATSSVSVREVIASLESYEPVRDLTRGAVARHGDDPEVSVTVLRAELERVLESPIVLNRGVREAVLRRVRRGELSMSEIATRCGRVKRDSRGNESGETSWLARRLGILPEGGHDAPTPWIHSDVLALISRRGLGIGPREVEL